MSAHIRGSGRLPRRRRYMIYIVGLGISLSGLLWLMFHYLLVRDGEFGPQTHPLEPWSLALHGAFGFAAIWVFGMLWSAHIAKAWPLVRRRWSGGILTGIVAWLMVSGYLLYYTGNETLRAGLSITHWAIGIACPFLFLLHRFGWWARATQPSVAQPSVPRPSVARRSGRHASAGAGDGEQHRHVHPRQDAGLRVVGDVHDRP